jgi:excisionase family DNA binding protein
VENLFNVKRVADLLNLSSSCVYKKAENGEIPSVKIGTALRFSSKDIFEYIQNCTRKAETLKPKKRKGIVKKGSKNE